MANHQDSRIPDLHGFDSSAESEAALKARGNALVLRIDRCALQGRRNPPPLQGGTCPRARPRGVAPGWHAPRRWRVIVAELSSVENWYEAVDEIASASSHESPNLAEKR